MVELAYRQIDEAILCHRLQEGGRGHLSDIDSQGHEPIYPSFEYLYRKQLLEVKNQDRWVQRGWTADIYSFGFDVQKFIIEWTFNGQNNVEYNDNSYLSPLHEIQTALFASQDNSLFVVRQKL